MMQTEKKQGRRGIFNVPTPLEKIQAVNAILEETEKSLIGRRVYWDTKEREMKYDFYSSPRKFNGVIIGTNGHNLIIQNKRRHSIEEIPVETINRWTYHGEEEISRILWKRRRAFEQQARLDDPTEYNIYTLTDPRTAEVFYVGATMDIELRYKQHLHSMSTNKEKDARIQAILAARLVPLCTVVDTIIGVVYAREREQHWIHAYDRAGAPLTNKDHVGVRHE